MTDVEIPITWITDHTGFERLHNLGDALHEQETAMGRDRYFWAVHPTKPIILCRDNASNDVIEWMNPADKDKWIITWLREMTTLVARKRMH
jgi:hypothetical protein